MKKTTLLAGSLLASAYSASGALTTVFAPQTGAAAETYANGAAITGGANDGVTTNGVNGNGAGFVSTVTDNPGVAGSAPLSFSFDGSSARIVTDATDLLTDDAIAAAGGYTISTWFKTEAGSNAGNRSFITFAGTDGLNIQGGNLVLIDTRGNPAATVATGIDDGLWHQITVSIDTSADPDGTANSTPEGPAAGVHGLIGALTVTLDGTTTPVAGDITIGDFGDFLNRTISVGGHTQGFGTTEFTGLLNSPVVSLGTVPEPSTSLLAGLAGLALLARRRR